MTEGKNLYDVIKSLDGNYTTCILNIRELTVIFSSEDIAINAYTNRVNIYHKKKNPNLCVNLDKSVKFLKHKETDEWIHFKDSDNSGYMISIQKAIN